VFGLRNPILLNVKPSVICATTANGSTTTTTLEKKSCPTGSTLVQTVQGVQEDYLGDTMKPRLSVGFGVNWNSPFGPFRIDIAKALIKAPGDDTKLITFNVGTAFQ
jgi:outer membrane protein insertion porin family